MKLTKKIVYLVSVLALSCTFAVSAAEVSITEITEADGTYSVALSTTDVASTDQYTVLVYRTGENGILSDDGTLVEGATTVAASSSNITYINQDDFSTLTDSTIEFELGPVSSDGVYAVSVGGTDVSTAAVSYFEIGEAAADEPTVTYVTNNPTGVTCFTANETFADGTATIDVTPAMGYKISNVAATVGTVDTSYNAAGGTITVTGITADTTITITTVEYVAADTNTGIVTYSTVLQENGSTYVFGKVPAVTTDEFGIDLDGTKYPVLDNRYTTEKAFGIRFGAGYLEAGNYTAKTYAGDAIANTSATFTIAE